MVSRAKEERRRQRFRGLRQQGPKPPLCERPAELRGVTERRITMAADVRIVGGRGGWRTAHGARQPEGGCAWRGGQGERGVEAGHWRAYRLRQAATGAAGSMEPLRSTPRLAFPREQLAVGVCSVAGRSTPCASEPGLVTSSRCRARNQAAETECGREARGGVGGWGVCMTQCQCQA